MYVLSLNSNRKKYVAINGYKKSYTCSLKYAKKYNTFEEAKNDSCFEGEYPVKLEDILG